MKVGYWVYILASQKNGTLYIGCTNDIARRVFEHKEKLVSGFTKKYNVSTLVHAEMFQNPSDTIQREKQLKHWNRDWKLRLINENNPEWVDLYDYIN